MSELQLCRGGSAEVPCRCGITSCMLLDRSIYVCVDPNCGHTVGLHPAPPTPIAEASSSAKKHKLNDLSARHSDYKTTAPVHPVSSLKFLSTIAWNLSHRYDFPWQTSETPTFSDVLAARRAAKENALKPVESKAPYTKNEGTVEPLENVFSDEVWNFCSLLNGSVKTQLHEPLQYLPADGITVMLPSNYVMGEAGRAWVGQAAFAARIVSKPSLVEIRRKEPKWQDLF